MSSSTAAASLNKKLLDFKAELSYGTKKILLEVPVEFPYDESRINEFVHLILSSFKLPIFLEEDLSEKLTAFIKDENCKLMMGSCSYDINPDEIRKRISEYEDALRNETLEHSLPEIVGDSEVFAEAYHSLVHSPMLGAVLRKESALNSAIREMHRLKYLELASLTEKQTREMSDAVANVSQSSDLSGGSRDVNYLAALHFDDIHLIRTKWESLIETQNSTQRREFRDWILLTYEEYFIQEAEEELSESNKTKKFKNKKKLSVRWDDSLMISYGEEGGDENGTHKLLQESFTIHLGSQNKQMYNIRLLSTSPLQFLKFKNESSREISPLRLQTAISLYSNDISGIVLLLPHDFTIYSGTTKDLIQLCQQTTEFHFESFESQLESRPPNLQTGDFFVTKHSNLNGVHVIFHLVVEFQKLNKMEINSRDPVILGLRNILKTACLNDITTITIPALLAHEMADFMSTQWCSRRAELVYKCVKGFMIETASWGGADMKNLQFFTPKEIDEETFNSLSAMLPNIFRVSNPLRLSASMSNHNLQA